MYNTVSLYICLLNLRKAISLCLAELFHLWEVIYSFWTVGQCPRKITLDWHFFYLAIQLPWSEMHNHISLFKFYSMTGKTKCMFSTFEGLHVLFSDLMLGRNNVFSHSEGALDPYRMGRPLKVLEKLTFILVCSSEQPNITQRKGSESRM